MFLWQFLRLNIDAELFQLIGNHLNLICPHCWSRRSVSIVVNTNNADVAGCCRCSRCRCWWRRREFFATRKRMQRWNGVVSGECFGGGGCASLLLFNEWWRQVVQRDNCLICRRQWWKEWLLLLRFLRRSRSRGHGWIVKHIARRVATANTCWRTVQWAMIGASSSSASVCHFIGWNKNEVLVCCHETVCSTASACVIVAINCARPFA